jgi:hypothetical protein
MFWMKINKNLPNMLNKVAVAQHFCWICWVWQKPENSLTTILDWLDILIGPSGLLLVNFWLLLSQVHMLVDGAWN